MYANILDLLKQLNTAATSSPPAPQSRLDAIKKDIKDLIDYQTDKIQGIQTKAAGCVTALQNYETLCGTDKQNMETSMKAFTDKLTGSGGEISTLEAQINAKRTELANAQAEYEQGQSQNAHERQSIDALARCEDRGHNRDICLVVGLPLSLCVRIKFIPDAKLSLSWPIGPIIAAVVAGVYADKAIKMKALIDAIKDLISSSNTQLAADKAVVSDLGFMKVCRLRLSRAASLTIDPFFPAHSPICRRLSASLALQFKRCKRCEETGPQSRTT